MAQLVARSFKGPVVHTPRVIDYFNSSTVELVTTEIGSVDVN